MLLAAFRLAFHFRRPVSELNISLREFFTWNAYLDMEPPHKAENERLAVLLAHISNMSGKVLPKGKTAKPDDFLPKKKQTQAEQIAFMKSLSGVPDGS